MKRLRFEVRRVGRHWRLFQVGNETILWSWPLKANTVAVAVEALDGAWRMLRIPSELVIKDRKGRIQDTRTYGEDPRRTKG